MNTVQERPWARRLGFIALLALVFALGYALRGGSSDTAPGEHSDHVQENVVWTCSMHPQIQMPEFGACPICGMDLIPLESSGDDGADPRSITLSASARKIAEIQTTAVSRQAVETNLRMVGKLEADETRVRTIAARVPGRIDRLYVDYTGVRVRRGAKLFDLYSPELYAAQEELLQAISAGRQLSHSSLESARRSADRTIEAARERLRLWGLNADQIEAIEERGTTSEHLTITAPMSGTVVHKDVIEGAYVSTGTRVYTIADLSVLWLKLDAYESELGWVKPGQTVDFETDTYPGEIFTGEVAFVDPVLDERSRTVKVRVNVANQDRRLKPGMFARAVTRASIDGDGPESQPLVIPATAPLVTGKRAVVYVENPQSPGEFQGREIVLGPKAGEFYVVVGGLEEGEHVVSNGSFKIDSALQILAKESMMNPQGGGAPPGHHHGDGDSAATDSPEPVLEIAGVPEAFRSQLDPVLDLYFQVSTALSLDDAATAQAVAGRLPAAIDAVDHSSLPSSGQAPWDSARKDLQRSARVLHKAPNMKSARMAFFDLSNQFIDVVRAFGASGNSPVLVYHCPMAMDNTGADWLQSRKGTENPYYGSQMYKCGSETEVLVAGPLKEKASNQDQGSGSATAPDPKDETGHSHDAGH